MSNPGISRGRVRFLHLFTALALLLSTFSGLFYFPNPARAATTVGTGTPASCDWNSFKAAVTVGGDIYFNCGAGNHTIQFLNNLYIATNTAIYGNNKITLDGQGTYQHFYVYSGVTLSLDGLTLQGGNDNYGGAVNNNGNLIITNSSFSANSTNWHGGAIFNGGTVNISNSTFSNNSVPVFGGAIYNIGTATISNSTFSNNTADSEGGVLFNIGSGTVSISSSTFYNNSAPWNGGALANEGLGTISISNSTFYNNSTSFNGGAIFNNSTATISISNSTFYNNSAPSPRAAIFSGGTANVKNTILANNSGGNCYGTMTSSNNLQYGDSTCNSVPVATQNPLSAAGLANNGGFTQTIALDTTWNNPAIGGGDVTVCASAPVNNLDQRGQSRPQPTGTTCDIGAYETDIMPLIITTQPTGSTITSGSAANLSVVAGGGVPPYSYQWYNGTSGDTTTPVGTSLASYSTGTLTVAGTHNYWVKVSDSGSRSVNGNTATVTVNPGLVNHLTLSGPATVNAGTGFNLTLTAYDQYNNIVPGYTGKVHFTGGGTGASLPADYTFTGGDAGVHTFSGVILYAGGNQTITVTDNSPTPISTNLAVTVAPPTITITPGTLTNATIGTAYSQSITASGGFGTYTYARTVGTLPAGLSLTTAGLLSGTPTEGGNFSFSITATDQYGNSGTKAYTLSVDAPTLVLSPASLSNATAGAGYLAFLYATKGTAPYTYALATGSTLPSGLSLSTSGTLSGSPTLTLAGTYNFSVTATDSSTGTGPFSTTRSYTLVVNPRPANHFVLSGPATVNAGTGFNLTLTAYDQYNNIVPGYTGKVHFTGGGTGASLPADYTFTGGDAGVHTYSGVILYAGGNQTITVSDNSATPMSTNLAVTVAPPTITLSPGTLTNATIGAAYSQSITASGGFGTYTYARTVGTLPAGLSLTTAGLLSGTPTEGGNFSFSITATDQYGNTGTKAYTLSVDAPTITLSPASLPDATAGAAYIQSFSASGGIAPYTYALATGSTLPSGLNLTNAGVLSGTPTVSGSYNFSVTATDSSSGTGPFSTTKAYTLNVNAGAASGISVVSGSPQNATISTAFALPLVVKVTDSNGNPVSGATVSFAPPASGASASLSTPVTTGSNGQTSVSATANSTVGSYKVTASIPGASTTFNLTNCDPAGCGAADVEIKVASDNPRPEAKQPFTLTTTATNHGPFDVTGLVVSAKIPLGLQCQSHQSTPGTGYNHNTGLWTIGNLASGVSVSLSIKCSTTGGGQVTFKAETGSMSQPDSNPANNSASVSLNAIPERLHADLGAGLTASVSGETVTFNLTIKNLDKGRAVYPYVLFPLDPSLELQSAGFGDGRDWVKKVESEGTNPHLEIRFHDLNQNEQATASLVFRFKEGVEHGQQISQRFQALWDDDFGAGQSRTSNRVSFARGQEGVSLFKFDPASSTVAKGSKPVLGADFFAPDEKVELWYTGADGKSVALGYRYADREGKLGFSFKTAELPEGVYVVAGRGDHSGITSSAVVTVDGQVQSFSPEKSSVKAGEKIRLEGEFFGAGERVTYWYTSAEGKSVELGYLWADSEGQVSFELDTTGMAAGEYTLAANGNTSGVQARAVLEVTTQ